MTKKLSKLFFVALILLLSANWAMAGNNVLVNTDVPNIPKSDCDQAGNVVMEFESGAKMEEGDTVTFSLSNNVSVCKDINFFLKLAGDGSSLLTTDTSLPVYDTSDGNDFLYISDDGTDYSPGTLTDGATTFEVGFLVKADDGDQNIVLTLGRRVTNGGGEGKFYAGDMPNTVKDKFVMSYLPDENDNNLVVRFFDQKTSDTYFYKDDSATNGTQYTVKFDDSAPDEDDDLNVLCIDTSAFADEYVLATPTSTVANDTYKLGFDGNYRVAHITGSDTFAITLACKDDCPDLSIEVTTDQWGNETKPSNEMDPGIYGAGTERWTSSGTCDTDEGNGVMLSRSGSNFTNNSKYTVTLELNINNSSTNEDTVSWKDDLANNNAVYRGDVSDSGKCSGGTTAWTAGGAGSWAYVDASDETKIVQTLTAGSNYDAFMLDLPVISYDYTKLNAGDEIQVKITFGKYPCGGDSTATLCLGKVVASCPSTASYALTFPFATAKENTTYWTGINVVNLDSLSTTVNVALYDVAGGSGTLSSLAVIGRGSLLKTIGDIVDDASFVNGTTALDTTKDLVVEITADRKVDGVCFVGSFSGEQLHGYLPRVSKDGTIQH